jgi:acyl-CoA thioester hydrolase
MTRIELAMEPSAGAFVGREHRLAVRVYYEDTDFTGFVYHASYARFFERGRSEFLRVLGFGHAALLTRSDPLAFAVLRLDIQFLKAARIDDALVVITTWGSSVGARMKVAQEIRRGVDLIATAAVEAVCITPTGAARRPPADLVARLAPLLAGAGDLS